jgi:hypothetical protein
MTLTCHPLLVAYHFLFISCQCMTRPPSTKSVCPVMNSGIVRSKEKESPRRSLGCCNRFKAVRLTPHFVTSAIDLPVSLSVKTGSSRIINETGSTRQGMIFDTLQIAARNVHILEFFFWRSMKWIKLSTKVFAV